MAYFYLNKDTELITDASPQYGACLLSWYRNIQGRRIAKFLPTLASSLGRWASFLPDRARSYS
jgi:hypothetical protein